jgi:hypothetical protein
MRAAALWCLRAWIVVGWLLFVPLSIYLGSSR